VQTITEMDAGVLKLRREKKRERADELGELVAAILAEFRDRVLPIDIGHRAPHRASRREDLPPAHPPCRLDRCRPLALLRRGDRQVCGSGANADRIALVVKRELARNSFALGTRTPSACEGGPFRSPGHEFVAGPAGKLSSEANAGGNK
jgi:hypothetical protein